MRNLLDMMRQETTELHHALHEHPLLMSCQQGTMNKAEYVHLVSSFYKPWQLLIPSIDQVPINSLVPKLHARANAIRDDLNFLHVEKSIVEIGIPVSTLSKDKLLGMCYVLIGSSLGASMLCAKIKDTLGDVPMSYLSMSPKEAGWPELVGALRSLDVEKFASAPAAACDTFALIGKELSKLNLVN